MRPLDVDGSARRVRRDRFWTVFWLVGAVVLLLLPLSAQQGISTVLRNTGLAPFLWVQASLQQGQLRATELDDVRAQLDEALVRLVSLNTLQLENQELRALMDLRDRLSIPFVAASAIRPGTRGSESLLMLDVGIQDGVSVGDPVISAEGLLGVVREVGPTNSLALDWTHPDFAVSVMTEGLGVGGIVEAFRGSFREEDRLLLKGVAYYEPVEVGELLVTSGLGAFYPRGIPVGWVEEEATSDAGWQRRFWVRPRAAVERVTHVVVLIRGGEAVGVDLAPVWTLPPPEDPEAEGSDEEPMDSAEGRQP